MKSYNKKFAILLKKAERQLDKGNMKKATFYFQRLFNLFIENRYKETNYKLSSKN